LAQTWLAMGMTCYESSQLAPAAMYLEKAVQYFHGHKPLSEPFSLALAQMQLGKIYRTQDRPEKSEAALLEAVKLLGDTAYTSEAWLEIPEKLMSLYTETGRRQDELRFGKAVIKARQASAMMHLRGTDITAYQVGLMYRLEKNPGQAERYARIALEHARNTEMVILAKALLTQIYLDNNDRQRATRLSHQAYEEMRAGKFAAREMPVVYDNESLVLMLEGRPAAALRVIDEAFATYGKKLMASPFGYNLAVRRLCIYLETGEDEKFRQAERSLLSDGRRDPRLQTLLSRFHQKADSRARH
jgi:tetratricopeptide (TPR) repeat protein